MNGEYDLGKEMGEMKASIQSLQSDIGTIKNFVFVVTTTVVGALLLSILNFMGLNAG